MAGVDYAIFTVTIRRSALGRTREVEREVTSASNCSHCGMISWIPEARRCGLDKSLRSMRDPKTDCYPSYASMMQVEKSSKEELSSGDNGLVDEWREDTSVKRRVDSVEPKSSASSIPREGQLDVFGIFDVKSAEKCEGRGSIKGVEQQASSWHVEFCHPSRPLSSRHACCKLGKVSEIDVGMYHMP